MSKEFYNLKYKKYKEKYFLLRQQLGGTKEEIEEIIKTIKNTTVRNTWKELLDYISKQDISIIERTLPADIYECLLIIIKKDHNNIHEIYERKFHIINTDKIIELYNEIITSTGPTEQPKKV